MTRTSCVCERGIGVGVVPGAAEMGEVFSGRFDGGDLGDAFGGLPGERGGSAVRPGVGEPAFGGGDEATGVLAATALGEAADDARGIAVPGEGERSFGELIRGGEIEKGRKQGFVADFAGSGELRDGEQASGGIDAGGPGQRRVGGAEVDADDAGGDAGDVGHVTRLPVRRGRAPSGCRRWEGPGI